MERGLRPCSNKLNSKCHKKSNTGALEEGKGIVFSPASDSGGDRIISTVGPDAVGSIEAAEGSRPPGKDKGVVVAAKKKKKATHRDDDPFSSSCDSLPFPSSSSSSRQQPRGVHVRSRRRSPLFSRADRIESDVQNLALPLGMSFAAIVAQVFERNNLTGERISADRLSMICSSAVKEAVTNVCGNRFDNFMRNFERSFGSTLKTLRVINEGSLDKQRNPIYEDLSNCFEAPSRGNVEPPNALEEIRENQPLNSVDNQLILHGQINQQLAHLSQHRAAPGFSQSVWNTFEKSVTEQARSNDLKEVEIGLSIRRLQLKQSQLDLSYYANILERIKISMGISKANFKEEKLKNQMQDVRHAEMVKSCIDYLVAGLIIMSGFLVYGASVYSYKRITEATASCTSTPKEYNSWWVPKPMASLNSTWLILRCNVVVLSRMSFGVLMILAVAYSVFQRSASTGSAMPVTFILILLGVACGIAGKLCVDTLGGSGYCWFLYWEAFCLLHFIANAFPSALYYILYGPVSMSGGVKEVRLPYWVRRYAFYCVLLFILPTLSGLMPFASLHDWQEHFCCKINSFFWRKTEEL